MVVSEVNNYSLKQIIQQRKNRVRVLLSLLDEHPEI